MGTMVGWYWRGYMGGLVLERVWRLSGEFLGV